MPLILGIIIAYLNLTRILVDKGSSCNVIYIGTMDLLGIQQTYLRLYNGGNMLAFNDYATHLQRTMNLIVSFGEGAQERKVIPNIMVISCRSMFKGILGRPFLARLDAVASLVHLKVTYHDEEGGPTVVSFEVDEAKWIKEIIQKNIITSTSSS